MPPSVIILISLLLGGFGKPLPPVTTNNCAGEDVTLTDANHQDALEYFRSCFSLGILLPPNDRPQYLTNVAQRLRRSSEGFLLSSHLEGTQKRLVRRVLQDMVCHLVMPFLEEGDPESVGPFRRVQRTASWFGRKHRARKSTNDNALESKEVKKSHEVLKTKTYHPRGTSSIEFVTVIFGIICGFVILLSCLVMAMVAKSFLMWKEVCKERSCNQVPVGGLFCNNQPPAVICCINEGEKVVKQMKCCPPPEQTNCCPPTAPKQCCSRAAVCPVPRNCCPPNPSPCKLPVCDPNTDRYKEIRSCMSRKKRRQDEFTVELDNCN